MSNVAQLTGECEYSYIGVNFFCIQLSLLFTVFKHVHIIRNSPPPPQLLTLATPFCVQYHHDYQHQTQFIHKMRNTIIPLPQRDNHAIIVCATGTV